MKKEKKLLEKKEKINEKIEKEKENHSEKLIKEKENNILEKCLTFQ